MGLFQNLCDSKNACLPSDLTSLIPVPPTHPWSFVAECAETVFSDVATAKSEEREKGKGKNGKGKWGKDGDWGWGMEFMDPWMIADEGHEGHEGRALRKRVQQGMVS